MAKKTKLLSIGEMSKITGAGIKALHYYEKIKVLKPAYTDPNSGYRYYSLDQAQLVSIIMYCVELGIPLKDLAEFTDADDTIDLRNLLLLGEKIALGKIESLKQGLTLLNDIKTKMDLYELNRLKQIHHKKIPEKRFYVYPCGDSFIDFDQTDMIKSFFDLPFYNEIDDNFIEFGLLCEYYAGKYEYYTFIELPEHISDVNEKIIPAGTYTCRYNEGYQIIHAAELFKEHLGGKDSFLAIETGVITANHKINRPINELRIIAL